MFAEIYDGLQVLSNFFWGDEESDKNGIQKSRCSPKKTYIPMHLILYWQIIYGRKR